MLSRISAAAVALLLAALPWAASAADPADAAVAVPIPDYRSAFAGYRKAGFEARRDWRQANDTVREVGGHAGSLTDDLPKEGAAPDAARPAMPQGPHMNQQMHQHMPHHMHQHGGMRR